MKFIFKRSVNVKCNTLLSTKTVLTTVSTTPLRTSASTTKTVATTASALTCAIENEQKPNPTFCFSFYKCVSGLWTIKACPKFVSLNITYVYDIIKKQCVPSTDPNTTASGCYM